MFRRAVILVLSLSFSLVFSQTTFCDNENPCVIGCCGGEKNANGQSVCGLGPDFCGTSCVGQCDQESECDPGWVYNSKLTYSFCGATPDFCGSQVVQDPVCTGTSATERTIGYYESWAVTRPCERVFPEDIPAADYTHLIFSFVFVDPVAFEVAPMDPADMSLYARLTALKTSYPRLKSMNDPDQPTRTTFSDLANSPEHQFIFFLSLISFMETYPGASDRSGIPSNTPAFPQFLANLRQAFTSTGHPYGLSITLPASFWYLQHFDIVAIEHHVDRFNFLSYDLHGVWDAGNNFLGPNVHAHTNLTEIEEDLKLLWRNNIDPGKVNLGIGFYGRSFTLADPACNTAGCIFTAGAPAGPCTQSSGTLSYNEIQDIITTQGVKPVLDVEAAVQTLVYDDGNSWVSFDDATTFAQKIAFANLRCLGGTLVWAVSLDASGQASAASKILLSKWMPVPCVAG
ncbi:chitinase [Xylogone sp. PMI_703]|nr:chitinase [Xylogone sp. PMI_703]